MKNIFCLCVEFSVQKQQTYCIVLNAHDKKTIYTLLDAADIYDEVSGSVRALGLDTECLGGGRIEHFPESKLLKVYGYSTVSCNPMQNIFHSFLHSEN